MENTVQTALIQSFRANYANTFGKHGVQGMFMYDMRNLDTGDKQPFRFMGIAGRFSYTFDNRYVTEFNFGYNGSENFAKGKRYGFFPSVALGWIVSEEKFMEPVRNVLSKLKLRGSYGLVGNDCIGAIRGAVRFLISLLSMKCRDILLVWMAMYTLAVCRKAWPVLLI